MSKRKIVTLNSIWVLNHLLDAVVWRVKDLGEPGAFQVGIIEVARENDTPPPSLQWVDRSLLRHLSIGQVNALT